MHPLRTTTCFALLVAALLLAAGCGSSGTGNDGGHKRAAPPKHSVLTADSKWTITLRQDSAGIVAEGDDASRYDTQYDFHVARVAAGEHGTWIVAAKERNAQGPFAQGYQFSYRQQADGSVKLTAVRLAGRGEVPAAQARGVVGLSFPLDEVISRPPKDRTVQPVGAGGDGLPPALPGKTGGGKVSDLPPQSSQPAPGP